MDYEKLLNPQIVSVKPSGIRKFFDLTEKMENVISLVLVSPISQPLGTFAMQVFSPLKTAKPAIPQTGVLLSFVNPLAGI